MRILALDIGEKRVGVAVCDPDERVASPVCVLPADEVRANAKSFQRVLEDWEPELLLCGLPMTLSGEEGPKPRPSAHSQMTWRNTQGFRMNSPMRGSVRPRPNGVCVKRA